MGGLSATIGFWGMVHFQRNLGLSPGQPYQMHDLLTDQRFLWHGSRNFLQLDPARSPAHIFVVRKQVRSERRRYHERFRALVEEGQRAGVFSSATPADLVVDYHFGSVHHLSTWYRPDGPLTPQQVADHLADLLLRALRP